LKRSNKRSETWKEEKTAVFGNYPVWGGKCFCQEKLETRH
jgi:hypothetical protein